MRNDFNRFGRTYQVNVQAEPRFRLQAEDIVKLQDPQRRGRDDPLSSFVTVVSNSGPDRVMHYNGFATAENQRRRSARLQHRSGTEAQEDLAHRELPNGMSFEWTELTYQQILAGNTMIFIFPLVVLLVFLVWPRNMKACAAAGGHHDHAHGAVVSHHRRGNCPAATTTSSRKSADRSGRPRQQERDSHRRVCARG